MRPTVKVKRKKHIKIPNLAGQPTRVKVGYPAGETGGEIIKRAIWNHYGTHRNGKQHIPPRPWLLNAMRQNRSKYLKALKVIASQVVTGKTTLDAALRILGRQAKDDVINALVELREPANAPSTIRAKGSSNPLIDTGDMRTSTTFKVDK